MPYSSLLSSLASICVGGFDNKHEFTVFFSTKFLHAQIFFPLLFKTSAIIRILSSISTWHDKLKLKKKTRPIRTPHDTTSKNIIRTQVEKFFLIATQLNYVYLGIQIYILSMKFSKWYTGGPLKQLG